MKNSVDERISRIFKRNQFEVEEVKYLTHKDQRTYFHLLDGRNILTSIPLKTVAACLPEKEFWSIQKGVVVAARHVISIDDTGLYTMTDGQQFHGRTRNPAEHKRRRMMLGLPTQSPLDGEERPKDQFLKQCTFMEHAPIAFCVIELVFAPDGRGIDFVFRYCNREMEVLEGLPVERMLDHSFYEVFPDGDKKWIMPYLDVAINGNRSVIREYSPEIHKNLVIRCFRPHPGYCACLLTEDESKPKP